MTSVRLGDLIGAGVADLVTGPFGTQLHASEYVPSGTPVINVRNVGLGDVRSTNLEFIDEETTERLARHLLEPGDIVFGRKGAVERHALITHRENNWLQGSDCIRLRLDPTVMDPRFVSFALRTPWHQRWMQNHCASGATMASLNQDILRLVELPNIPIAHQRRIAAALGAFDDLIENNRRRVEILEEMARLIYREWFVHFRFPGYEDVELVDSDLGLIPDGWPVTTLAEHAGLERRSVTPAEQPGETFDLYSIPAFDAYRLPAEESGSDIKSSKYLIAEERVLLSKLNPRFPRVWRVDASRSERRSICSTEFLVLVTDQDWPASFVHAMVGDSEFGGRLAAMAGGTSTSHQRVKPGDVMSLPVVGPEASLVSRYHELANPMLRLADNLIRQNEVLRETRDLLLPRLVSGELDVSGLDLELAEVG